MPITQDRMIALANAGHDYQTAYQDTWKSIEDHYLAVQNGEETAAEALQSLFLYNNPRLRVTNMQSAAAIAVERSHFRSFQGKNNRAAKWARKQRKGLASQLSQDTEYRQQSFPRQTSAPESIERTTIHAAPPPAGSWAERSERAKREAGEVDITADTPLDFGEPDKYVPGQLTQEQKDAIDAELDHKRMEEKFGDLLKGPGPAPTPKADSGEG